MTEAKHVKTLQLFKLSQAGIAGKKFQLEEWETEHLQQCAECQGVVAVFSRQPQAEPASPRPPSKPTPRCKVGDYVTVAAPSPHRGKQGLVFEITEGAGDFVYRYRVRFPDEQTDNFFGFELEIRELQ